MITFKKFIENYQSLRYDDGDFAENKKKKKKKKINDQKFSQPHQTVDPLAML